MKRVPMEYYYFEAKAYGHRFTVHLGNCPQCVYGTFKPRKQYVFNIGHWSPPFNSCEEIKILAQQAGARIETCRVCHPPCR